MGQFFPLGVINSPLWAQAMPTTLPTTRMDWTRDGRKPENQIGWSLPGG